MIVLLVLGIFVAIVFGKGGIALMKGLLTLAFGLMLLMVAGAIV